MEAAKGRDRKVNKTALIAAALHFVVSFFTDRLMFQYAWMDFSSTREMFRSVETIGVKLVFFLVLFALWQAAFWAAKHADRFFLKVAGGYLLLMVGLLLLTWPGIWRMDEFGILSSSVQLFPHFWQNYITSVFYILAMMLLPFPAGVIIVQCVCIALIVARLVTLCVRGGDGAAKKIWPVLLFPFLMFPVLDSNLYPIRMSLYAFLEVLLIAELFFLAKRIKIEGLSGDSWKNSYWLYMTALAVIVTLWRTEAIYYLGAYPVILLMLGYGRRYVRQIVLYFIVFVILFAPQKIGEKLTSGRQYELTSVVLPLVPLVVAAEENGDAQDQKLLDCIDQVVNVEVTLLGAAEGKSGINLFWGEPEFQRAYTEEQFAEFKSAYYQLAAKYPKVFLQERLQTFWDSSDLLENTTELFTKENVANYETFKIYPLSLPISDKIRTGVIEILELRVRGNYDTKFAITDFVYSPVPAIVILAIASVILLLKRKWTHLIFVLTPLAKVPLVFLTAPSRLFMYYYSVYLFGYCVLFYIIYQFCIRKPRGVYQEAE